MALSVRAMKLVRSTSVGRRAISSCPACALPMANWVIRSARSLRASRARCRRQRAGNRPPDQPRRRSGCRRARHRSHALTPMIRFTTAKLQDLPRLHALVEKCYRGDSARQGWTHEADLLDDTRTSEAELAAVVADDSSRVLLAGIDGQLAGTVTITDKGNGRAYLGMLCVDPALQAEGLGRALLADAEDMAAEVFGTTVMEMTVIEARPELIAYYERRGYVRTGETRPFPAPGELPFAMVVLERDLRGR
jgi:ribosomal protein S18 acetylase RimI-like enzyme